MIQLTTFQVLVLQDLETFQTWEFGGKKKGKKETHSCNLQLYHLLFFVTNTFFQLLIFLSKSLHTSMYGSNVQCTERGADQADPFPYQRGTVF